MCVMNLFLNDLPTHTVLVSHRSSLRSYALEVGLDNRLTTHNIVPYTHLMFSYVENRRHAFIEPVSKKSKQYLIRVRRHNSMTDALICADRNDRLRLRRGSHKFLRSRECHWKQHQVLFNKRKIRWRRKRRDLLSPNAYRYESKYGAFLSVTLDGNITLSRSQDRNTKFRLTESPVHKK